MQGARSEATGFVEENFRLGGCRCRFAVGASGRLEGCAWSKEDVLEREGRNAVK